MRTFVLAAGLAIVAVCATATPAAAQTCVGRGSFAGAPWQARVETSYSNSSKSFGSSITRDFGAFFAGGVADLVGYPGVDQSAASVGGTIGAELGSRARRVQACPVATVLHQFGPNIPGASSSANVASFGGRIGVVASENATLRVVPTFGMDFQYEHDMVETAISAAASRHYTDTRLGVGFVLNQRTAIVPEIIQIYGVSSDTTIRLSVAFGFGGR
jgi:hypothetical protein